MRAARYDQVYLVPIAHSTRVKRGITASTQLVDREFGDEYRSDRLPAGWFMLPSAIISFLFLSVLIF